MKINHVFLKNDGAIFRCYNPKENGVYVDVYNSYFNDVIQNYGWYTAMLVSVIEGKMIFDS